MKASGTTLTEVFGVGPVIAGIVLGEVEDVSRFRDRDLAQVPSCGSGRS